MTNAMQRAGRGLLFTTGLMVSMTLPAAAQLAEVHGAELLPATVATSTSAVLPEAPSATLAAERPLTAVSLGMPQGNVAPLYTDNIMPGQTAQALTAKNKVVMGLRDTYSVMSFLAIVTSAGYEQVTNGAPNYGTDKGAFGERLGAAGLRETAQTIFTESVFAPILREDPRYYVRGDGHNFFGRTFYAITRPLITRTDSGHETVNASLLLGYGAATATSYGYYPSINQNAKDMASAYGGSLGGAALGFFVAEFQDDFFQLFHHKN